MIQNYKLKGTPEIIRNQFECQQVMVPSHDGIEIPMNLFYKKDGVKLNRRNRVLIDAYGAYGLS